MPATFESFGIKFLYPDNWVVSPGAQQEETQGVTLELPSGGFFSIDFDVKGLSDDELFERVAEAIREEYEDLETEKVMLADAVEGETAIDYRFFYLDLVIVSRVILLRANGRRMLAQFQAESRDFDANEMVLNAILKQIREQV